MSRRGEAASRAGVGIELDLAGVSARALPDRGLFLAAERTLLVADLHLGKPSIFAGAGIPVPVATSDATLARLDGLLAATAADTLVVLGDLWHGRLEPEDPLLDALAAWRGRHAGVRLRLVVGNHDRRATDMAAGLGIEVAGDHVDLGPLRCRHHPEPAAGRYVIAGHTHPVLRMTDIGGAVVRLPCFLVGAEVLTLPAAGAFTGGHPVRPAVGERALVCAEDRLIEVGGRR